MTSRKKKVIDYHEIAKELKKLGFIDYDLRKGFTKGEKSNITKKYNQARDVIKNSESYVVRRADSHIKKEARKTGLLVSDKFIFIEKGEFSNVKIKTVKKKHGRKETTIIKSRPGKKESTKLIHGKKLLDVLNNFKGDLPKGQYMTVKIGKNSPFKRRFAGAKELHAFATSVSFKLDGALIEQMSIVTFSAGEGAKDAKKKKATKKNRSN